MLLALFRLLVAQWPVGEGELFKLVHKKREKKITERKENKKGPLRN